MSDPSSEERRLPASHRKLRKGREKGQVLIAREVSVSMVSVVAILWLFFRRDAISSQMAILFAPEDALGAQPFDTALQSRLQAVGGLAVEVLLPFFLLVPATVILTGLIVMGGPVFSFTPVIPKFEKLSPAQGLKRMFGRRALITFLMHLVRLTLFSLASVLVILSVWSVLMRAPVCGFGCAAEALALSMRPLLAALIVVLLFAMIIDYLVQRSLFLHDMRMSVTERRREYKEIQGDPAVARQRRADRRALVERPLGLSQATVVIESPGQLACAIRYVEGDTVAPLIVAKVRGPDALSRLYKTADCPLREDHDLAQKLWQVGPVGTYVTDEAMVVRLAQLMAVRP